MSQESPFQNKSERTKRSPTRPPTKPREPSLIREDRTRRQLATNKSRNNSETETQPQTSKSIGKQTNNTGTEVVEIKQKTETRTSTVTEVEKRNSTPSTNNALNMDHQKIQQLISNCIPEFGGSTSQNKTSELVRFLDMADSIYDILSTAEEKTIFAKLIKFRLVNEAYMRVSSKQIKDYPAFRQILNGMYSQVYTLEELERNFCGIKQEYGETITEYGYRISEALEKYKNGFKVKYEIGNLDEAYGKHLDNNGVLVFKRGLNNTILREKVATSRAKNILEIIEETESMEKMLIMTTGVTPRMPTQREAYTTSELMRKPGVLICHYCHKPGHTWKICHTRMNGESRTQEYRPNNFAQNNRYGQPMAQNPSSYYPRATQRQESMQYQPDNYQNRYPSFPPRRQMNTPPQDPTSTQGTHTASQQRFTQQRQQNEVNSFNRYRIPENNNMMAYRQMGNTQGGKYKYCSYCKTTRSHTFDECRNKLHNNMHNHEPRNQTQSLEESFGNMKINMVEAQPVENSNAHEEYEQQQGNEYGLAEFFQ